VVAAVDKRSGAPPARLFRRPDTCKTVSIRTYGENQRKPVNGYTICSKVAG